MKKLPFEKAKQQILERVNAELLNYDGAESMCDFKCNVCNNIFNAQYHNIKYNKSCPHCRKIKFKKNILEKAKKIHGEKYDYIDIPENSYEFFKYVCKTCNETHTQHVNNHVGAKQGCPRCCKPTGGHGKVTYDTFLRKPELKDIPATFYILKMTPKTGGETFFKYGCTTIQLSTRLANVRFHSQCDIEIVYTETGRYLDMHHIETQMGFKVDKYDCVHKWLGSGECFVGDWKAAIDSIDHSIKGEKTQLFLEQFMNDLRKEFNK